MRIEDYALIGDCHSAALVGRDGSIDWLCWPRFDSAACFAALLGDERNGRWKISPCDEILSVKRSYRADTLVLETVFETAQGEVALVDFMPTRDRYCNLVRLVVGRRGRVAMDMQLVLRFDYGASVPWVTRLPDGKGMRAVAGPDMAVLRADVPMRGEGLTTVSHFEVGTGETVSFVLTHSPSHLEPSKPVDPQYALRDTEAFWKKWASQCTAKGEWAEAVRRSAITLKALTYEPTGGVLAAPTTSLPERLGGVRNWDYRFCWLRDASITLLAMIEADYNDEAQRWRDWFLRAIAGDAEDIQIMYAVAGERRLPEFELDHLPGYEGSRPVRIGNAASRQRQLDVYGELIDALFQARSHGLPASDEW